jgi:hypothetical protein
MQNRNPPPPPFEPDTMDALWAIFIQICLFWDNLDNVHQYRSRLESFVINRIANDPTYHDVYTRSVAAIKDLIAQQQLPPSQAEAAAYQFLFTDQNLYSPPPNTDLKLARQKVANELIMLQLALGGFKAFGATNYCGYFGGPNIPGEPPPYRPMEKEAK